DPFAGQGRAEIDAYRALSAIVPAQDVVAVSPGLSAPAVAWYADRRAVHVPEAPERTLATLRGAGLAVPWYLARPVESAPSGFRVVQSWPQGFVLWRSAE